MSLQSIMDATTIVSWRKTHNDECVGTGHKHSYLICKHPRIFEVWWDHHDWYKTESFLSVNPQLIIDKINELEGIKNAKSTQE